MSEPSTSQTTTMRAIVYRRFGSPDVLSLEEMPRPEPGENDVVIKVEASTVGPPDCAARAADPAFARLAYGLVRPKYSVLGGIAAGRVEAVGAEVKGLSTGDQVVGETGMSMGAHAEYVRVPHEGVVAKPDGVTHDEAVAVVDGGLTALPFLRDHAGLRGGQTILVNGASGGVGTAAVQLAKHFGAVVTGVCSTANVEFVRSLGADKVVDYTKDDFTRQRDAYDVIFDAVGKSSFSSCRDALKPGGVYLTTVPTVANGIQTLWTSKFGNKKAVLAFTGLRPAGAATASTYNRRGRCRPPRRTPREYRTPQQQIRGGSDRHRAPGRGTRWPYLTRRPARRDRPSRISRRRTPGC